MLINQSLPLKARPLTCTIVHRICAVSQQYRNLILSRLYYSLHKIAADIAIEATSVFLGDIRSAVGDDIFAKFLNLKSEKSMALVIDISGSMTGEPLCRSVMFVYPLDTEILYSIFFLISFIINRILECPLFYYYYYYYIIIIIEDIVIFDNSCELNTGLK